MAEVTPVPGRIAVEAGTNTPTGKEAKALGKEVGNLSLITVDAAAGGEIPTGLKDNLFVAYFGDKDPNKVKDPVLKPLALGLNQIITQIETNLKTGVGGTAELNKAIIETIRSNEGWKKAFELLDPGKQAELIKTIREMGAVSSGRKLYVERMVIAKEGGGYEAAKRKYDEVARQVKEKTDERNLLDTQIKGKDRAKIVADKDAKAATLESLKTRRQSLSERRDKVELKIDELTEAYRQRNPKTGAVTFNKAGRDADPDYKKYKGELTKIDDEVNGTSAAAGLDAQIIAAQGEVSKAEKAVAAFERHDVLVTDIDKLSKQLIDAEGDLITARTAFADKINELIKSLGGVFPEAAKAAMNKYKVSIDHANEEMANAKAAEAAKSGEVITGATANVEKFYLLKYVKEQQRRSSKLTNLFGRNKSVQEIDTARLQTDFKKLLRRDARGAADLLKADVDAALAAGHGAGLSPEEIKYFNDNPQAYAKFIEQAKQNVFKTVSRQAVLHLDLTETDMKTLIGSDDFATAAEQAVGDAQKLKDLKEKIAGAGLKGGTWKEIGAKLAKPALIGLAILILIIFGVKGFGGN